jgi:hypothetical protein
MLTFRPVPGPSNIETCFPIDLALNPRQADNACRRPVDGHPNARARHTVAALPRTSVSTDRGPCASRGELGHAQARAVGFVHGDCQ